MRFSLFYLVALRIQQRYYNEVEQTPAHARSFGLPITIIVVGVLVAGFFLLQRSNSLTVVPSPAPTVAGVRVEPGTVVIEETDPVLGAAEAPTTIFLFTQFHCAYCRHFFEATFPQLKAELLDTGKARLVFKVFPIGEEEQAVVETERAARAAFCAKEQDLFWSYVQRLSTTTSRYEQSDLSGYAQAENLNMDDFDACLGSEAAADWVAAQIRGAVDAGITATPTIVINDELHEGDLSYAELAELL